MNVTRIPMLATSLCLTLLGTIALAQSVTYERDRSAPFSRYKTYAWARGTELTDERAHASVVRAIDAALAAKGLEWVKPEDSPRVLVAYHASFDENFEISGSVRGSGPIGLADDGSGLAAVQQVPLGTLVIDITEAWTGAIVWRSRASSDIRPTDTPESRDKKLAKAIDRMFKKYPALPNDTTWLRLRGLVFKSLDSIPPTSG